MKASLLLSWNDGHAGRLFQQVPGNALVGRRHDLVEDPGRFLNAPDIVIAIRRQSGQDQTQARCRYYQHVFVHDIPP
jgi:hypothetical protein